MAPKNSRPKNNINRPWEPGELAILKLAENLNSEGLFWPEQFNKLSFWKDTDGNHTIVRRNKAGKLRLVRVDKKYAGRFNRLLVEEIPPQVEAIFRDMESAGKIPKGTYEEFEAWQSSGVRRAFAKSAETTQRTGIDTEGGHLLELQSKRAGSGPFAHAHTEGTIINEGRNPYPNAEGIPMPGNNPKQNDPQWHLDPKEMDAAGLPSTWAQLMNQFLTGKSGANVERISEERLRQVRDKEINLGQAVAEQDQENQKLAWEEGERYRHQQETEEGRKQLLIENQDKPPLDQRLGQRGRGLNLPNQLMGIIPAANTGRALTIFGNDYNQARQNANALNVFNAAWSGVDLVREAAELVPGKVGVLARRAGFPMGWVQDRVNEAAGNPRNLQIQPTELPEPTITQNTDRGIGSIVDNFQQAYENLIYGDRDTSAYDRKIDLLHEEAQQRAVQLNSTKTFR